MRDRIKDQRSCDQNSGKSKIAGRVRRLFGKFLNHIFAINGYDATLLGVRDLVDSHGCYQVSLAMKLQHVCEIHVGQDVAVKDPKIPLVLDPIAVFQQSSCASEQNFFLFDVHTDTLTVLSEKLFYYAWIRMGIHQDFANAVPATQFKPDRQ